LDFAKNFLTKLPPDLRNCTLLTDLRLDSNRFKHFPPEVQTTSPIA
jgi:Leucine-rich repeat (LRR) protein